MESNKKIRNLPTTTFLGYEYEYLWICELVGSWGVQPWSYSLSLNMWTTEFVQRNNGITIVVELKLGLPKSRFI